MLEDIKENWKKFLALAVGLLYIVAILILNFAQISQMDSNKVLYGLNPIKAFSSDYIFVTIGVYISSLIGLLIGISGYFGDDKKKSKGLFSKKQGNDGYSKWASKDKFKKILKMVKINESNAKYGGLPLINDGKKMWVDDGEAHSLIIGSTGSGKTQMAILPLVKSLGKNDESMIITDPKGEIYVKTSKMLKDRGYKVILLNFRNPSQGSGWNPLTLPYQCYINGNKDKASELVDDLGINILYDENAQGQDPFWEKTSSDYFSGLTMSLFEDAKEEEINLNSINSLTTVGEEKYGRSTYINEYFKTKDKNSAAYISASSTLVAPDQTKSSILAVFKQKLRLFASRENISEMLSHSDFDMGKIGEEKTAVFIIIHDEKKTYHPLVTIFIKQCYETLVDIAQKHGGQLPIRTNFLLDEFANMPPLKDVETMVSAARSRKMRFNFVIQNFAQLNDVYGKEKGDTIKGNCTNIVYLLSSEMAALEEISKMCGEQKSKDDEKTTSTPLATVSDLQRMEQGEVIILRTREYPFKTKLKYDWETKWSEEFKSQKDAEYPHRSLEIVPVFDLKSFIENKKTDSLLKEINVKKEEKVSLPKEIKPTIDFESIRKKIDTQIKQLKKEENNESPAQ